MDHKDAFELLPWYVNGTLQEGDDAAVAEHLKACKQCRQEAETLHKLEGMVVGSCNQDLPPPAQSWRSRMEQQGLPPQGLLRFPGAQANEPSPPDSTAAPAGQGVAAPDPAKSDWKQILAIPLAASVVILASIALFQNLPSNPNQAMQLSSPHRLLPTDRGSSETFSPKGETLDLRLILEERASRYDCSLHFGRRDSAPLLQQYFEPESTSDLDLNVSIPASLLGEGSYWLIVRWESAGGPQSANYQFHIQHQ